MSDPAIDLFCDIPAELGEGPSFDPASGATFWFDIEGKTLFEKPGPSEAALCHPLPFMASALCVIDEKRQLVAAEDGLYFRDAATGDLTLHRPLEAQDRDTRSNDGRVHPCGALWIGTMHKKGEAKRGAIYWYREGEIRRLYTEIGIPNSICFSPDGRLAYFTDTKHNRLMRVETDARTGLPLGEPELFLDSSGEEGGLDGSVCDAEGTIWNARWGTGTLDRYAPDGKRIARIALPARQVTCPAFIGPNADRLIVTSAWTGMFGTAREADPHAGKTFLVDLAVKGIHEPRVKV